MTPEHQPADFSNLPPTEADRRDQEMIRAERDEYRKILYPAIWRQYTEEELRRFAEDEDETTVQPLEQFLGDLEDVVDGQQLP